MTTPAAPATAPLLTGQTIGLAYHAIAAVRDRLLAGSGLTFHRSVALKAVADGFDRDGAVDRVATTLRIDASRAHALLDELAEEGLVDAAGALTDAGDRVHRGFTDAVAALTERLYGDLPTADREIAARALAHVTARADAELSGPDLRPLG
ncbi:hypothetical protein [Streptomyces sp. NPDC048606]|uniref:hypothetical protein n=1 Tax=Streptomyces sp. NPDC048606 TaxID=3154726 RepID=UPI003445165C